MLLFNNTRSEEAQLKALKIIWVMLTAVVMAGCGGVIKGKPAAERAVVAFHQLFNEGKFDEIWKDADPKFRGASTRENYDEFIGAVSRKLGKVTSTSNAGWNIRTINFKTTIVMTQKTAFENGGGTETFTFALDGTNAVLLGWNVQSTDLITK